MGRMCLTLLSRSAPVFRVLSHPDSVTFCLDYMAVPSHQVFLIPAQSLATTLSTVLQMLFLNIQHDSSFKYIGGPS